jgi:hypothetical protein
MIVYTKSLAIGPRKRHAHIHIAVHRRHALRREAETELRWRRRHHVGFIGEGDWSEGSFLLVRSLLLISTSSEVIVLASLSGIHMESDVRRTSEGCL